MGQQLGPNSFEVLNKRSDTTQIQISKASVTSMKNLISHTWSHNLTGPNIHFPFNQF